MNFYPKSRSKSDIDISDSMSCPKFKGCCCKHLATKSDSMDKLISNELKNEVEDMKKQILQTTSNKEELLKVTKELQTRFRNLLDVKRQLCKEMERLREENESLSKKVSSYKKQDNCYSKEIASIIAKLDSYEEKLSTLYKQFRSHSDIIKTIKPKLLRYIKKKARNLTKILDTNNELFKIIEEKDADLEKLRKSYKDLKKIVDESCPNTPISFNSLTTDSRKFDYCDCDELLGRSKLKSTILDKEDADKSKTKTKIKNKDKSKNIATSTPTPTILITPPATPTPSKKKTAATYNVLTARPLSHHYYATEHPDEHKSLLSFVENLTKSAQLNLLKLPPPGR